MKYFIRVNSTNGLAFCYESKSRNARKHLFNTENERGFTCSSCTVYRQNEVVSHAQRFGNFVISGASK